MNIEYLSDGSSDCPLLRIYGNRKESLARLRLAFLQLANGVHQEIELNTLWGFEAIGECRLVARVHKDNPGVTTEDQEYLRIELSAERWLDSADMTASLLHAGEGTCRHFIP
jgi:hypothetical protein